MLTDNDLDRLAERIAEKLAAKPRIEPRMMNVEETAAYLGRTPEAIERMLTKGKLPKTKLDGRVQVDRQIVDLMIKARTI